MVSRRALFATAAAVGVTAACSAADQAGDATQTPSVSSSRSSGAASTPTSASPTIATSTTATPTTPPSSAASTPAGTPSPALAATLTSGLTTPWGLVFLPSGAALVGERNTGRLLTVTAAGAVTALGRVAGVVAPSGLGEGGLLGLALHPDDPDTLFAYLTTATDNRVVRLSIAGGTVGRPTPVLTGIPTSTHHHGGALLFADGLLYVTTGDAENSALAQDRASLAGKILRITPDGAAAPDNPYGNRTWSYGHRNIEGLAIDEAGRLWATEFGEKQADELNLIERGGNYGWPTVEGRSSDSRFVSPAQVWSPTSSCSPAGLAITRSTAFVGALQGKCLFSVPLTGAKAGAPTTHFPNDLGRIRTVRVAPDGSLWITTSNTDGRVSPGPDDDKIVRVTL